jgi:hypothetical protein
MQRTASEPFKPGLRGDRLALVALTLLVYDAGVTGGLYRDAQDPAPILVTGRVGVMLDFSTGRM